MNRLKIKIKKLLSKIKLKKEISSLGEYKVEDDTIMCYVTGENLKKQSKAANGYNLIFEEIKTNSKEKNKKVHYIIENIFFDKRINLIISQNCNIIFKNCTFRDGIFISGRYVTFEDCKFEACVYSEDDVIPEKHFYIMTTGSSVDTIKFIDTLLKIKNIPNPIVEIWLNAKKIELHNTNMTGINALEINCDKLTLDNSSISSRKNKITAKSVEETNSAVITVKLVREEELLAEEHHETIEIITDTEIIYDSESPTNGKKLIRKKKDEQ